MPDWLVQGGKIPQIELHLTDGSKITLPDDISGRYLVLLFYRGNW